MLDLRCSLLLLMVVSLSFSATSTFAQGQAQPAPKPTTRAARPPAAATKGDPFVGVWRLSPEKSKYESGGPPKGFTRTYEDRGGGTIFLTTDATTAQGTTRSYLVYRRDGKPYPEAATGAESIRLVTVKAIDRRTEELAFIVNGKPLENTTTITISADGQTMTQILSGKSQGRTFTNTVVYDKQP